MSRTKRRFKKPPSQRSHASKQPKGGASSTSMDRRKKKREKQPEPTIPFQAEDRILLVGEGDFSFAKSIVENHGCCNVTASCLDSRAELLEKYPPQGEEHVQYLEDEGQTVLFEVDATTLDRNKHVKKAQGGAWDVVMFNFPHVGGRSTDVNRQVRFNQELLVEFFRAAMPLLASAGTIVVTLFEGEPYTLWNVKDLARHSGLQVQRSFRFQPEVYPGYSHARTLGNIEGGGGWKGEDRESRSYVFEKKASQAPQVLPTLTSNSEGKRKRHPNEDFFDDEG